MANTKTQYDNDELAQELADRIQMQAKSAMPAPVQVQIIDGSMQFDAGWVWGTYNDRNVRVIVFGPSNITGATAAAPYTVWALPPNPDSPTSPYIALGVAYVGESVAGAGLTRIPPIITSEITNPSGTSLGGTVTSVAMSVPSILSVAGSPITTTGTLAVTLATQSANLVFAGPTSGGAATPIFRSLVSADIPDLTQYLILAGRAGGQTASGGTAASETLNLNSTAHATKGIVNLGGATLRIDEALTAVGIKGAALSATALAVYTAADATKGLVIRANSATQSANLQEWQDSVGTVLVSVGPTGTILTQSSVQFLTSSHSISGSAVVGLQFNTALDATRLTGFNFSATNAVGGVAGANFLRILGSKSVAEAFSHNGLNIQTDLTAATGTQNLIRGMLNVVRLTGAATLTQAFALHGRVDNTSTGTIGTAIAAYIDSNVNSGGGVITTNYGVQIAAQTVGVTNYALETNAGLVVINQAGDATSNFRVEGDTDANLFLTTASSDVVSVGGVGVSAQKLTVYTGSDTNKGVVVKANSATQSANLTEWQNSSAAVIGAVNPDAHMALGANAIGGMATIVLSANEITTDVSNNRSGASVVISFNSASNSSTLYRGGIFQVTTQSAASGNLTSSSGGMVGGTFSIGHNGSGTVTSAYGGVFSLSGKTITDALSLHIQSASVTSGATWTNYYGIYINVPTGAGSITNVYGLYIGNMSKGGTLNYAIQTNAGNIVFNEGGDASTDFRVEGDTDANLLFTDASADRAGIGTNAPTTKAHVLLTDAGTNAVVNTLTVGHDSSGTPAAGFGAGFIVELESSTTAAQSAGRLTYEWATATHASRKALSKWTVFDTAEREAIRIEASGSAAMIGLYGVTAIVRPATGGAASTFVANTSGIVDDTATWDSYTIGQIVKALRNLGILT